MPVPEFLEQEVLPVSNVDKGDGTGGKIFRRGEDSRKRLKKRNFQKRLAELGYTNIVTLGVSYHYYRSFLERERDPHWIFDVMEWVLKRKEGVFGLTTEQDVLNRWFQENPFNCIGVVPERKYGLIYPFSSEVVLMHDYRHFPHSRRQLSGF